MWSFGGIGIPTIFHYSWLHNIHSHIGNFHHVRNDHYASWGKVTMVSINMCLGCRLYRSFNGKDTFVTPLLTHWCYFFPLPISRDQTMPSLASDEIVSLELQRYFTDINWSTKWISTVWEIGKSHLIFQSVFTCLAADWQAPPAALFTDMDQV